MHKNIPNQDALHGRKFYVGKTSYETHEEVHDYNVQYITMFRILRDGGNSCIVDWLYSQRILKAVLKATAQFLAELAKYTNKHCLYSILLSG